MPRKKPTTRKTATPGTKKQTRTARPTPGLHFTYDRLSELPPKTVRDLQHEGWQAGWDGQPSAACPYRRDPDNPASEYEPDKASAWLAGWAAAQTDLTIHRESTPESERRAAGEPGRF